MTFTLANGWIEITVCLCLRFLSTPLHSSHGLFIVLNWEALVFSWSSPTLAFPTYFVIYLFLFSYLAEQTSLDFSYHVLFEVVTQELRTFIVDFSSFSRRERDPLIVSVCILWRTPWLTLWGLSRIPWKVCSHTNHCKGGTMYSTLTCRKHESYWVINIM